MREVLISARHWTRVVVLAAALAAGTATVGRALQNSTAASGLKAVTGAEVKCENGKANIYECQNANLLSFLPWDAIGGKQTIDYGSELAIRINGMWGWTDPNTKREFAIVGRVDGTALVEVTDPVNPKYLGDLPLHEGAQPSIWREMKVYKNYAFIVSDAAGPHGIQIFDLTQLLSVKDAPVVFKETVHYDRLGSIHNIVIDTTTGFAYSTSGGEDCGNRMQIIDINNPLKPTFAGCSVAESSHDAQCLVYHGPTKAYDGHQLCLNSAGSQLEIVDVTDKKNPAIISTATYPSTGYVHQGWFTDDHRYFFMNDEGDEGDGRKTRTIVFDLQDLKDPVVAKEYFGPTEAIDHNLYTRGQYVYEANYKAGLRVLDASTPADPKEVAYFDTTPNAENNAAYGGAWNNYPYYKDGVVGISSISEGLFLVRPVLPTGAKKP